METGQVIRAIAAAALIVAAAALPWPVPGPQAAEPPPVTVYAAASMTPALTEIAALREKDGIKINLVFASSGVLARQIANGAPADLFISASRRWMDWLAERGLVDGTPAPLVGNRLVLIQPADAPGTLALDDSLASPPGNRLAIGDPAHVPAGMYAKEALDTLGLWSRVERSAVFLPNVRAALLLVERGEAAAGIVYQSDAAISRKIRVAATFPPDSHAPIIYFAGTVASGWKPGASALQRYLQRPDVQAVFRRHGFLTD